MATGTGKMKAGRRWGVDSTGITSLKRTYRVVLDSPHLDADGECTTFPGVPALGSVHPVHKGLAAESYEVEEGSGADKCVLTVTVNYQPITTETSGGEDGETEVTAKVERWGWDSSTDERELTTAVDGTAVLNSAGDPFDSVPQMSVPAPAFTKILRFTSRQNGWQGYFCTVNKSPVTIGGISFPPRTLLCQINEERILGDKFWNYRYTVQLKYKSNKVKIGGEDKLTEIGWDVAVTDAGMREKGADGKLTLIRQKDAETGKMCTVSSPELLNGSGQKVDRSGNAVTPYNFRFQAYAESDFPQMFYSEPPLEAKEEEDA